MSTKTTYSSNQQPNLQEGLDLSATPNGKHDLTIIKVGGAIVEDNQRLTHFLDLFAQTTTTKILIHGGGRRATKIASAMGIDTKMVEGRRVTDAPMLEVVTMVYGGLVNKNIVACLQARGINALGLTGADMDAIRSHRRPPVTMTTNGTQVPCTIDYGFVGDVDNVNAQALKTLIENGVTPIMAPLTHDGNGNILNTNADTIASETAKALAKHFNVTLIYCFEKPGVLSNPDDDSSVIPSITQADFARLTTTGVISGGMKPKIENALKATEAGVKRVIITSAEAIDGHHGTIIV